jgi:hypothetical protein
MKMENMKNHSKLNAPIDAGIRTMLQHLAYVLLNELTNTGIKMIELAVQCDDPHLERIMKDYYHIYDDCRQLIKYFMLAGMNPIPDETWGSYQEMQKVFHVTREEMLSRLNKETKEKLKSKEI